MDAKSIARILPATAADGSAQAIVYGLTPDPLRVKEDAQALVDRSGIKGSLAKLTRPNNTPIWISATSVNSIRAPIATEMQPPPETVGAIVYAGGPNQAVRETVQQAIQIVKQAGGLP